MEWWNGLEWCNGIERYLGNFSQWSPLYKDHLLTKTTSLQRSFYFNIRIVVLEPYKTVLLMNCVPHVMSREASNIWFMIQYSNSYIPHTKTAWLYKKDVSKTTEN